MVGVASHLPAPAHGGSVGAEGAGVAVPATEGHEFFA